MLVYEVTGELQRPMRRSLLLFAVGLVLGLSIAFVYGGSGLLHRLTAFPLSLLCAVLTMILVGWNFSAGRMRLILSGIRKPMGHGRSMATVMSTEFAISATPAGSGGLLTYVYLLKRHGVSGTSAAAMYAADIMIRKLATGAYSKLSRNLPSHTANVIGAGRLMRNSSN